MVFGLPIDFARQVNKHLESRGVLRWAWDLNPTDNAHACHPEFTQDGEELFRDKQRIYREMQCLLCKAKHGPCNVEKCWFKHKEYTRYSSPTQILRGETAEILQDKLMKAMHESLEDARQGRMTRYQPLEAEDED